MLIKSFFQAEASLLGKMKKKKKKRELRIGFEVPGARNNSVETVECSLCRTSLNGMSGARLQLARLQKIVIITTETRTRD